MAAAGHPERPDRQPDRRAAENRRLMELPRGRESHCRGRQRGESAELADAAVWPQACGAGRDRGRYRDEAGGRRSGAAVVALAKDTSPSVPACGSAADRLGGPRDHHRRSQREGADSSRRDRPAHRQRDRLPASRLRGRDRELRRHRLVPLLRHAARRDRRAGRAARSSATCTIATTTTPISRARSR